METEFVNRHNKNRGYQNSISEQQMANEKKKKKLETQKFHNFVFKFICCAHSSKPHTLTYLRLCFDAIPLSN